MLTIMLRPLLPNALVRTAIIARFPRITKKSLSAPSALQ